MVGGFLWGRHCNGQSLDRALAVLSSAGIFKPIMSLLGPLSHSLCLVMAGRLVLMILSPMVG